MSDIWNMKIALEEAEKAFNSNEVPVGAVVVDKDGILISKAHNLKEMNNCASDHAEIIALNMAAKNIEDWRLEDCTLYTTLEPCVMCMGAIIHSRIKRIVFGAYDRKGGAVSLGFNIHQNPKLNHRSDIVGGVMHFECSRILSNFFKNKRKYYKS